MIVYKQGNIFESSELVIAHGVNCQGTMASGFAKEALERYPLVKQEYMHKFYSEGWKLGDIQTVEVGNRRAIVNCATQDKFGKPDEGPYVSYPAIRLVLRNLILEYPNEIVSMPKIGAGLAGGNWDIIERIINEESKDREVRVYLLK